jgi:hypothetical protein
MKKLLFISFFLLAIIYLQAQNPIIFSKVIQADSLNKTELFIKVNDWFATNYKSANDVIQMADKDAGTIIGKGSQPYSYGKLSYGCYDGYLNYTIKVYVKDNRFKIELTDFVHSVRVGNSSECEFGTITDAEIYTSKGISKSYHNKAWVDMKTKIQNFSEDIFASIESKLNSNTKEDNW